MNYFNLAYLGAPPWDIGSPQPDIVKIEEEGGISGSVLDAGCGTGENALYLADRGHETWGIDSAPIALRKAGRKARERGIRVRFLRADALDLSSLGRTFDTVIDCGLFHTFSDEERVQYVIGLAAVLRPGGKLILLCFSDDEPGTSGPRRVSQAEIRAAFTSGWTIRSIRASTFKTSLDRPSPRAWTCQISRDGSPR